MIQETFLLTASNTDLLSTGRLNAIPYNGTLTVELQASLNDGTNSFSVTLQTPNGDVPVDAQLVPANNPALAGVLDERTLVRYVFGATQGGHFTIILTEAGTATCFARVTLTP